MRHHRFFILLQSKSHPKGFAQQKPRPIEPTCIFIFMNSSAQRSYRRALRRLPNQFAVILSPEEKEQFYSEDKASTRIHLADMAMLDTR